MKISDVKKLKRGSKVIAKGTVTERKILPNSETVDVYFRTCPYECTERITVQVSDIVKPVVTVNTVHHVLKEGSKVQAKFSVNAMDKESSKYPLGLRCRYRRDSAWIYLGDIALPPTDQTK